MVVDQTSLAMLCDLLSALPDQSLTEQQRSAIHAMIVDARRGRPIGHQLNDLATQLGIRLDVGNHRGAHPSHLEWPMERSTIEIYRCPKGECSREWVRRPGCAVPHCSVNDLRLIYSRR